MPIYFIRAGESDMVKIGFTEPWVGVDRRIASLQSGHYEALSVLRIFDGSRRTERWLHLHYADRRVRGEWFRFCEEMLTVIPGEIHTLPRRFVAVGPSSPSTYVPDLARVIGVTSHRRPPDAVGAVASNPVGPRLSDAVAA